MSKPRLIAFYLPQYYPTPENDEWWGKGFTEWTNVGRAKPLFKGHDQPKVPADLGYYDLRVPEVRKQQAELAREAGIEGFCYWHYWFAGRRLLDRVFREVVESGNPDFPFCLCWANHSWYQKTWDPTKPDKLLMEQTYPGVDDYVAHFNAMLPAFLDKRYMKVDGKLLFGVYAPLDIPDFKIFREIWNRLAKENGLEGFYFFGFTFVESRIRKILSVGYDASVIDQIMGPVKRISLIQKAYKHLIRNFTEKPNRVIDYDIYSRYTLDNTEISECQHVCVNPNFDHTPRSRNKGIVLYNSTPKKWGAFLSQVIQKCKGREHNLIFIKAWNEWGEGNYLEPDMMFGMGYLEKTKEAITNNESCN